MKFTVLRALSEAKDALLEQKSMTPLKLFLKGWFHPSHCGCSCCEAIFVVDNAIKQINTSIVDDNEGAD